MILIRKGPLLNQTLASLLFDRWGNPTGITYQLCDTWDEISKYKDKILCIDSGTVFNDPIKFIDDLKDYPHYGLIGHIIDPKDSSKFYYLDEQCFYIDTEMFNDFRTVEYLRPEVVRSDNNLHDDYTPLWLTPAGKKLHLAKEQNFGESLIAEQLRNNKAVVNWSNRMRDNKNYLYSRPELITQWLVKQQDYINVAENQLWVFNNESMAVANTKIFLGPAAGLYWIKNLLTPDVEQLDLVDISRIQIEFIKQLILEWDGVNYGKFAYEFIKANSIKHWQVEDPSLTKIEKLKLAKEENFIEYANGIFSKYFDVKTFPDAWSLALEHKTINLYRQDIVKFLPTYTETNYSIWISNVLEYKYTLLNNTADEVQSFLNMLNNGKIIQL